MRVLIVNDDGIDAVGIRVLAEVVKAAGHEVVMIAPESERSAYSHSVTIFRDMRYEKRAGAIEAYAISGTPADCVKFGVLYLLKEKRPDLVLSGINMGPNLGFDVMYSGTVAAASEAAFLNLPAVAVSLGDWTSERVLYEAAAGFVVRNLTALYGAALSARGEALLSINYPTAAFKGVKWTKAGVNLYDDYFDEQENGAVQLKGRPILHADDAGDCDVGHMREGYATVTPLTLDRNHYAWLNRFRGEVRLT
jgi:5'-nucleotidase